MKEIIITISPDGKVHVEAKGFRGRACKTATEAYEKALGLVEEVQLKPEFRMAAIQEVIDVGQKGK